MRSAQKGPLLYKLAAASILQARVTVARVAIVVFRMATKIRILRNQVKAATVLKAVSQIPAILVAAVAFGPLVAVVETVLPVAVEAEVLGSQGKVASLSVMCRWRNS